MAYKELTKEQIENAGRFGRVLQNWYVILVDDNPTAIIQQKDIAIAVRNIHYPGGVIEPWPMQIK